MNIVSKPEAPEIKQPLTKWLWLAVKIAIMFLLYYFVGRDIEWASVLTGLMALPLSLFFYGLILQLLTQAAQAYRWRLFLTAEEGRFRQCFAYICLSYPISLLSPSRVLSDLAVAWMLGKKDKQVKRSVFAIFAGRIFGLAVLLLLMLFTLPSHLWVIQNIWNKYLTSSQLMLVLAGLVLLLAAFVVLWKMKWGLRIKAQWKNFLSELTGFALINKLFWSSVIIQILPIFFTVLVFEALAVHLSIYHYLFIIPLGLLILAVPLTPGQLGIREGLWIFLFMLFDGVSKEQVLSMVLYSYAAMVLFSVIDLILAGVLLKVLPQREPVL